MYSTGGIRFHSGALVVGVKLSWYEGLMEIFGTNLPLQNSKQRAAPHPWSIREIGQMEGVNLIIFPFSLHVWFGNKMERQSTSV